MGLLATIPSGGARLKRARGGAGMGSGRSRVLNAWATGRFTRDSGARRAARAAFRIGVASAVLAGTSTTLLASQATAAAVGTQRPGLTLTTSAKSALAPVYIADSGQGQVVEVKPGGRQVVVASGLSAPSGLALDAGGDVYVADSGQGQVVEVKPGGRQVVVASGLSAPSGLALD